MNRKDKIHDSSNHKICLRSAFTFRSWIIFADDFRVAACPTYEFEGLIDFEWFLRYNEYHVDDKKKPSSSKCCVVFNSKAQNEHGGHKDVKEEIRRQLTSHRNCVVHHPKHLWHLDDLNEGDEFYDCFDTQAAEEFSITLNVASLLFIVVVLLLVSPSFKNVRNVKADTEVDGIFYCVDSLSLLIACVEASTALWLGIALSVSTHDERTVIPPIVVKNEDEPGVEEYQPK